MAWFITRQTTAKYQAVYISGVPGMDEEEVERELQNLARLQAVEAAAINFYVMQTPAAIRELAAALDHKPAPDHGSIHNPEDYEY
jgi:hypothetical protein